MDFPETPGMYVLSFDMERPMVYYQYKPQSKRYVDISMIKVGKCKNIKKRIVKIFEWTFKYGRLLKMQSSHFDKKGAAKMVDISKKKITTRVAKAEGSIHMKSTTLKMIQKGLHKKGDVLSIARLAGIMGAKKTSDLIPLCHPLGIEGINIDFEINKKV